jgi:hypothetical protein
MLREQADQVLRIDGNFDTTAISPTKATCALCWEDRLDGVATLLDDARIPGIAEDPQPPDAAARGGRKASVP